MTDEYLLSREKEILDEIQYLVDEHKKKRIDRV